MMPTHQQRVLVTGGAGFIGSHLVDALLLRGADVVVLDNGSTGNFENLAPQRNNSRLEIIRGSAGDEPVLEQALAGVTRVFHLAAAVGVALVAKEPNRSIETNILPTHLLLAKLREKQIRGESVDLFFASTSEVYGKNPKEVWSEEEDLVFGPTTRPRWSYGLSKAIDEFLVLGAVKEWGLSAVIGRFFNVVGPRQSGAYGMVLPRFVAAAVAGRALIVHDDGEQTRCFAHVADVVAAVLQLLSCPTARGQVFNIGSDQPIAIRKLAERVIAVTGSSSVLEFQSYTAAYDAQFEDIRRRVPALDKLRQQIAFQPQFDLDAIIRDVQGWQLSKL